jgi:hypothetical protein
MCWERVKRLLARIRSRHLHFQPLSTPLPHFNRSVIATGGEGFTVGTEGDGINGAGVTGESAEFCGAIDLP